MGGSDALGGQMAFSISGATTRTPSYTQALRYGIIAVSTIRNIDYAGSRTVLVTGLRPGVTTFTAKYAALIGSCSFEDRTIAVVQL